MPKKKQHLAGLFLKIEISQLNFAQPGIGATGADSHILGNISLPIFGFRLDIF
jgi:hypothetical protein